MAPDRPGPEGGPNALLTVEEAATAIRWAESYRKTALLAPHASMAWTPDDDALLWKLRKRVKVGA